MAISNRSCLLFGLAIITLSCGHNPNNQHSETESDIPANKATEIVQRSIEKHGGWDDWDNTNSISYKKTIILFDSTGAVESRITQIHRYQLKPDLRGTIEWMSNSDSIRIVFADGEATKHVNNYEELDPASRESALNTVLSSFYVLFQPFKLMDVGTTLEYLGENQLENGINVNVIQPSYTGAEKGDDRWWYYFDKETNQLVANMVNHGDSFSYIINLEYDTLTSLVFNAHRKSFFVDSLRNIKYLRAEYFYEDFHLDISEQ